MRPRIGLASYWTEAAWTYWKLPVALVPAGYVEGVRLAGGLPLILPPTPEGAEQPGEVLDTLDGLVLIGGPDLGVDLYGSPEPHPETGPKQERRDAFELALLLEARRRGLPLLGICRGMQLLDVAAGGDLVQHLGDTIDDRPHRPEPGVFGRHRVDLEPGSLAASILGSPVDVHSAHHQGVGRVGEGLVVSARAHDGQVEAVEDPSLPFCLGVLWHPEEDPAGAGGTLFRALVEAARTYVDDRHGADGEREEAARPV